MVICLERGADLHMAQLMPLPLTVSCFSKIQIGITFLVPAYPGSPGKTAIKRVCVCVCVFTEEIHTLMLKLLPNTKLCKILTECGIQKKIQYRRVTDTQTDGRTHDDSIYHTSIASHGKHQVWHYCICPHCTGFSDGHKHNG